MNASLGRGRGFDTGPLSWIKGEIDVALGAARSALAAFRAGAEQGAPDGAQARLAHAHLHQAHGALAIVGLAGLTRVSETLEAALAALEAAPERHTDEAFALVERGFDEIGAYLDALMGGAPHRPLALLPLYRALAALTGTPADAVDLFHPDLSRRVPPREVPAPVLSADEVREVARAERVRFQRGFLRWLKASAGGATAEVSGGEDMRDALAAVEAAQGATTQRAFWWAALALGDALASGALPAAVDARRVVGRIEQQMKNLAEGSTSISDRLMLETLYLVAQADPERSARAAQVQETYALAAMLPDSGPARPARRDPGPAREMLVRAKEAWTHCSPGQVQALSAFRGAALALRERVGALGIEPLEQLVGAVVMLADWAAADPLRLTDAVGLEVAAALLLIEDALTAPSAAAANDFAGQSAFVCERLEALAQGRRLPGPDVESALQDETLFRNQFPDLIGQVAAEIRANLDEVEPILDAFFRNPGRREDLAGAERPLTQIAGAFDLLGETRARDAVRRSLAQVRSFMLPHADPQPAEFEALAQTLSGLGFFTEALGRGEADFDAVMQPIAVEPTAADPHADEPLPEASPGLDAASDAASETRVPAFEADTASGESEAAPAVSVEPPPLADVPAPPPEPVDAELLPIYLEEAKEVLATIGTGLERLRADATATGHLTEVRRGFHTLKGSGRMVGLNRLGEAAWAVEQTLNLWLAENRAVDGGLLRLIGEAAEFFSVNVTALETGGGSGDAQFITDLAERVREGRVEAAPPAHAEGMPDFGSLPTHVSDADSGAQAVTDSGDEAVTDDATAANADDIADAGAAAEGVVRLGEHEVSTTLFTLFAGESRVRLQAIHDEHETLTVHGVVTDEMLRAVHTLAGICGTVGLEAPRELGLALERALNHLATTALSEDEQRVVGEAVHALDGMVDSALELAVPEEIPGLIAQLDEIAAQAASPEAAGFVMADDDVLLPEEEGALHAPGALEDVAPDTPVDTPDEAVAAASGPSAPLPGEAAQATLSTPVTPATPAVPSPSPVEVDDGPPERRNRRLRDEYDPDLLPAFLEEAAELIPSVGNAARAWRAEPGAIAHGNELQRLLHTLKGSARMAGAMGIGDLTHYIETRAQSALTAMQGSGRAPAAGFFESLDGSFDRLDILHGRARAAAAGQPVETDAAPQPARTTPAAAQPVTADGAQPAAAERVAMLRVRASMIDGLVNQAGEVAIARSRIEGELRQLNAALSELTANVVRLRSQVREIEIQTEAQLQSRAGETGRAHEGFDPLEFDRFTRSQELTRFLAESVNDVQTLHQNLVRAADGMETALAAQARMSRDLQQDLMRVRMVPFAGLAERLHRIVRQTAKETGKRASLDINGGNVELDRSVLERITAPVEHMLRNAVAHGIETPEARIAAGKSPIGGLRIDLAQEGNEVVIALSDNGRGLDLARIRARAVERGLIAADAQLTEMELADLIFLPGFSTAESVTELAGRGVGMDVVKTEIAALGGRIEIAFEPGRGTRFTAYLPLTLAVTQAVLVRSGGRILALPTVMVEQVQQARAEILDGARAAGRIDWQGRRYPWAELGVLLGAGRAAAGGERKRGAAILYLRSGANALALAVEEIVSPSEEVVVKAIGPQLARVPGVVGATVLGSGEIVLILNPVNLAADAAARAASAVAAGEDVTEAPPPAPEPAEAARPLVMVVDDSLTVRKVSSRLLEREGYAVATARDGVEALEQLRSVLPAAMLVDIEMPRMDGFDLTRNLRADPRLAKVPVIMITSRTADKHREHALSLGVDAYLGKPYREDELLAELRTLIARAAG